MLASVGMMLLDIFERLVETWAYFAFGTAL